MCNNQKGFTLPEILVGMIIFIIILGCVNGLFFTVVKGYQQTSIQITQTQDSRQIITTITDELKYATTIMQPTAPYNTIQYTKNGESRTIVFDTVNKMVTFTHNGSSYSIARSDVDSLTFSQISTIGKNNKNGLITVTLNLKNSATITFQVITINEIF